jgi:hypothetical protein
MAKTKVLFIRVTEKQAKDILERTEQSGFLKISDYIRYSLFLKKPIESKIDKMYEVIVNEKKI